MTRQRPSKTLLKRKAYQYRKPLLRNTEAKTAISRSFSFLSVHATVTTMADMILQSTITCPACGASKQETMPEDRCVFFYSCESCSVRIKPKAGDCCVFCS